MPAPGDQHRMTSTAVNPFEEATAHVSGYTAQEIATLQSRLDKQLGPEYISSRPGAAGQKVHYITAEKCINLANEVFGFNGWSSAIQTVQIDFVRYWVSCRRLQIVNLAHTLDQVDEVAQGKISLGLSVIVRVTLKDGTFHEDIGYGHIENCKGKAAAFEKAKKEGTTDALKRALRNFGKVLGNCIYDKEYLAKITKVKVAPCKWDIDNLHRHPDFAPAKKEPSSDEGSDRRQNQTGDLSIDADADDEFGAGDEFDEVNFSESYGATTRNFDEEALDCTPSEQSKARPIELSTRSEAPQTNITPNAKNPLARPHLMPTPLSLQNASRTPQSGQLPKPQTQARNPGTPTNSHAPSGTTPQSRATANSSNVTMMSAQRPQQALTAPQTTLPQAPNLTGNTTSAASAPDQYLAQQQASKNWQQKVASGQSAAPGRDAPVGFFTARAAEALQDPKSMSLNAPLFNPHSESPSIRKTSGVDHSKTRPVSREALGISNQTANSNAMPRPSFANPQAEPGRRIGMPAATASPLQNRSSYRPPGPAGPKRPFENSVIPAQRPPLGDVTTGHVNVPTDRGGGGDSKRQRIGEA
ncbi:MAG: hypothetical protein M1819_006006 [Sarea resinae]|nr:MAG: hypothetical protein M1819_006006 [Sarea resinae]